MRAYKPNHLSLAASGQSCRGPIWFWTCDPSGERTELASAVQPLVLLTSRSFPGAAAVVLQTSPATLVVALVHVHSALPHLTMGMYRLLHGADNDSKRPAWTWEVHGACLDAWAPAGRQMEVNTVSSALYYTSKVTLIQKW